MKYLSEQQSIAFFERTKASHLGAHVAVFGAKYLIWLMLVLLVVYYQSIYWLPFVLLPWGVSLLISTFVKRPRPYQKNGFKPLMIPTIETWSFPSEHATVAFAIAGSFYLASPAHFAAIVVAACVVALSRVAVGVHYFSDVLMGAFIGASLSIASQISIVLIAFFI